MYNKSCNDYEFLAILFLFSSFLFLPLALFVKSAGSLNEFWKLVIPVILAAVFLLSLIIVILCGLKRRYGKEKNVKEIKGEYQKIHWNVPKSEVALNLEDLIAEKPEKSEEL